ncbi:MAG: 1-(5-phosphoribosyl)-5-[(5-phosphoribosylamino)methylideneamino]imidazole-4-carboxamide isomerase [Clostridia bacterium]|nr:1-(5-phosphoribosyl)-5-[(5-phosphoribosylamino)methylideneamino]imidazole-4-carboxamide isomerase [Clostridia bacterium]
MKIFPAIDIKDGRVVRLQQGDFSRLDVYAEDPRHVLSGFVAAGVDCLHIVDLDGAVAGEPQNFAAISPLLAEQKVFTQIGGGIRDLAAIELYLQAGARRVILGTAAWQNKGLLCEALARYGEQIAVGVDARNGKVAVDGWLATTDADSFAFCQRLRELGVATVIYTDISRDGMLGGCNIAAYRRLAAIEGLDIVASGGISSLAEIANLRDMGIAAAIVGKALYEGRLDLTRALAVARGEGSA